VFARTAGSVRCNGMHNHQPECVGLPLTVAWPRLTKMLAASFGPVQAVPPTTQNVCHENYPVQISSMNVTMVRSLIFTYILHFLFSRNSDTRCGEKTVIKPSNKTTGTWPFYIKPLSSVFQFICQILDSHGDDYECD
jgi:hypothetical protein